MLSRSVNEVKDVLVVFTLLLEASDAATVGENSNELKHGVLFGGLLIDEFMVIMSGLVFVNVHAGEDEGRVKDLLHRELLEVGLVPLTLGAVSLGEEEDKTLFLLSSGGPFAVLNQSDEVRTIDLKDIILEDGSGVTVFCLEID